MAAVEVRFMTAEHVLDMSAFCFSKVAAYTRVAGDALGSFSGPANTDMAQ